jgi:glycosyltransferase involved in cell wall biosynthesis
MPFFVRHCYSGADEIVAVSKGVAADLGVRCCLPWHRIKVIYNPVLTPELLEKAREPVEHPWLAPNQPPVVLGVGRLTIQKDFSTLLRAFAQVRQRRPAKLLILGEGDQRRQLEALSRELGVDGHVCLAGYRENPHAYMARAQVFVLSSIYEGFGLVLVEAMASGVPVVSTDCESGPREVLQDGRYGTLVPIGNVEALAQGITAQLDHGRQSIPSDWLHNFKLSKAVDAYLELITERRQSDNGERTALAGC